MKTINTSWWNTWWKMWNDLKRSKSSACGPAVFCKKMKCRLDVNYKLVLHSLNSGDKSSFIYTCKHNLLSLLKTVLIDFYWVRTSCEHLYYKVNMVNILAHSSDISSSYRATLEVVVIKSGLISTTSLLNAYLRSPANPWRILWW